MCLTCFQVFRTRRLEYLGHVDPGSSALILGRFRPTTGTEPDSRFWRSCLSPLRAPHRGPCATLRPSFEIETRIIVSPPWRAARKLQPIFSASREELTKLYPCKSVHTPRVLGAGTLQFSPACNGPLLSFPGTDLSLLTLREALLHQLEHSTSSARILPHPHLPARIYDSSHRHDQNIHTLNGTSTFSRCV